MEDPLCPILNCLFPQVARLALDAGISSWLKVKEAAVHTGLTIDEVIRTKCRLIADTLAYILGFTSFHQSKVAWWIRLKGRNHFNQPTGVGHALVLLEREEDKYLLIDGYIGCRGLTCRYIDLPCFKERVERLQQRYDPDLWYQVTGCREVETPDHVRVIIREYSYSDLLDDILSRCDELASRQPNLLYGHKGNL